MPDTRPNDTFQESPHALHLSGREWLIVTVLVLLFAVLTPRFWTRIEPLEVDDRYRIPYALSDDYWLYQRHLETSAHSNDPVLVIGDSVIWGEYVARDCTLSHFLTEEDREHLFVNAGVNGLFPLALEGLVRDFGGPIRKRKVLLHANLLWMTSPQADLSADKEQAFNHQPLVPQFAVDIPSYRAPFERRLAHLANRKVALFAWSKHLQIAHFDQLSIPAWTLEPENTAKNPWTQMTGAIPAEPSPDPERGEASPRHKPWSDGSREPQRFDWVAPEDSLQFAAFQRLVTLLVKRDNDVLVVIGPLNEHMIAAESRDPHEKIREKLQSWLAQEGVSHLTPTVLPSELYGDASHPLTAGYRQLAKEIVATPDFQSWLK